MTSIAFFKDAGEKLLNLGTPDMASDAIRTYIGTQGVDASGLTVAFDGATSTVSVDGEVPDQATREKIVLCCGNIKGVGFVNDMMVTAGSSDASQFYTVVSGDNMSKIAKQFYGDPNKYQWIFEANKPMLRSPDMIYPGMMLRIPPLA